MKKRVNGKSKLQSSVTKAIPLSVAIALMSAGNAFAATDEITINLDGTLRTYSTTEISNNQTLKDAIKSAFKDKDDIWIQGKNSASADVWSNFGEQAATGVTIQNMFDYHAEAEPYHV